MDRNEQFQSLSAARAGRIAEPASSRLDAWTGPSSLRLWGAGFRVLRNLLSLEECEQIRGAYGEDRSRVVMARHGFDRGEYKCFAYPLPPLIADLREQLYADLVSTANRGNDAMRLDIRYPDQHVKFLARRHDAGQLRPTSLLLRYVEGDYHCLHQDLYRACLPDPSGHPALGARRGVRRWRLLDPGGRPGRAARGERALRKADAVAFAVNERPVHGQRGFRRPAMRHGESSVRRGHRHTVGIIFLDAT